MHVWFSLAHSARVFAASQAALYAGGSPGLALQLGSEGHPPSGACLRRPPWIALEGEEEREGEARAGDDALDAVEVLGARREAEQPARPGLHDPVRVRVDEREAAAVEAAVEVEHAGPTERARGDVSKRRSRDAARDTSARSLFSLSTWGAQYA